uniref:Coiled-coil domain-containing protein 39 n=1 Tax=Strigamia maritima TaxID=126957 RepID=T1J9T5_STRMM
MEPEKSKSGSGPSKDRETRSHEGSKTNLSLSAVSQARQSIFRSLSHSNLRPNVNVPANRAGSPAQLTAAERNSIATNEEIIKRLELISYRFDSLDVVDVASDHSFGSSVAPGFIDDVSGLLKRMAQDVYDSSNENLTTRETTPIPDSNQMLILDPDHPLMQRFQSIYTAHLEKEREKQTLELNSSKTELKTICKSYEDEGETLYNLQQELSKSQANLENCHREWHSFLNERKIIQEQLLTSRDQHVSLMDLRAELTRWDLLINLMNQLQDDMRSDVGALRRAAEKVEGNLESLQDEKRQQDVTIKKKMEEAIRMEDTLEMYKKHRNSQQEELLKARLNLSESQMRIECIEVEKRHVFQQWKQTLSQLEQKDEAIKTLYESLTALLNESFTRSTNISNLKKATDKEMELNETLETAKKRTERLVFGSETLIKGYNEKSEKLSNKLAMRSRIVQESVNDFNESTKDLEELKKMDDIYRKQLDAIVSQRCDLEDQLAEKYLEYISSEKAIIRSDQKASKLRKTLKHTEGNVVHLENDLARLIMQLTSSTIHCQKLKEDLNDHNKEVDEYNEVVKGLETLISKNNLTISNKQVNMNLLIARLEQLVRDAGGDVSPSETKIHSLERNIESKANEMQSLKVTWLQRQTELVFLSHETDHLTVTCIQQSRQYNMLKDKKRRLEEKIEEFQQDIQKKVTSFNALQKSIGKLSESIYQEKGNLQTLTNNNLLSESTLVRVLKDAEMESVELQDKLDILKEDKKQLENRILELSQQILMWEKKTQLAKESKALVASEEITGEMQEMRWDIHRMQNRFLQLKRQQETLVQETEKLIARRETILSKNESQNKSQKKPLTKSTIQKAIGDLRNKLKQSVKDRIALENEIAQYQNQKEELNAKKTEEEMTLSDIKNQSEGLETSVRQTERHYQKVLTFNSINFHQLIGLQQRTKFLQSTKEHKYQVTSKDKVKDDVVNSLAIANTLQNILKKLCTMFPHYEEDILDLLARHEGRLTAVESLTVVNKIFSKLNMQQDLNEHLSYLSKEINENSRSYKYTIAVLFKLHKHIWERKSEERIFKLDFSDDADFRRIWRYESVRLFLYNIGWRLENNLLILKNPKTQCLKIGLTVLRSFILRTSVVEESPYYSGTNKSLRSSGIKESRCLPNGAKANSCIEEDDQSSLGFVSVDELDLDKLEEQDNCKRRSSFRNPLAFFFKSCRKAVSPRPVHQPKVISELSGSGIDITINSTAHGFRSASPNNSGLSGRALVKSAISKMHLETLQLPVDPKLIRSVINCEACNDSINLFMSAAWMMQTALSSVSFL